MKPDKFDIFSEIMFLESEVNHYGVYISVGQIVRILYDVKYIHSNYNENLSLRANIYIYWDRRISPMGDGGKNRL